ncbi:MAG: hypothetical protein ACRD09_06290 [Vicinamibacterales bacterium]
MSILFRRGVAIPVWAVWAVALGVAALSAPLVIRSLVVLVGLALIGSSALVLVRWVRKSRPPRIEVLPALDREPAPEGIIVSAGARARTLNQSIDARKADDADLSRMDGDAG